MPGDCLNINCKGKGNPQDNKHVTREKDDKRTPHHAQCRNMDDPSHGPAAGHSLQELP